MARRVLLVEDSEDIRTALAELLELLGHRVEAVADGLDAVPEQLEPLGEGRADVFRVLDEEHLARHSTSGAPQHTSGPPPRRSRPAGRSSGARRRRGVRRGAPV